MTATTIIAAIGEYDQYAPLAKSAEAAAQLADELDGKGYRVEQGLLKGGTSGEMLRKLSAAIRQVERDGTLILFWTGHGLPEADKHYLICRDSPPRDVTVADAIPTTEIGAMVAKSPAARILLVFDTCYSGQGALEAAESFAAVFARTPPGSGRVLSVLASAHPLEKAREAVFMRAIHDVLLDAEAPRRWSDTEEMLEASRIQESVEALLRQRGHESSIFPLDMGAPRIFIPNPRFGMAVPADDVETGRKLTLARASTDHFELASRGIETGQVGWYFTGRHHTLSTLVEWLKTAPGGIAVVTGPPGAGKSAVVGRLATLSNRAYREAAERGRLLAGTDPATLPPLGSIDVAVHAKGKTLDDCTRAIAEALDLPLAEAVAVDAAELVAAVSAREGGATIVLDALDEAANNHAEPIARTLLVPLSAIPRVRVLIGTRRSLDGAVIPDGEDRHGRLRDALGAGALILDLADEAETQKDIAAYVRSQLMDSTHKDSPGEIAAAADRVARASEGSFLYGRIVARTLKEGRSLEVSQLPATALKAFSADLESRFPDDRKRVNDLLGALAWGLGAGLSRKVWPQVATALADGGEYGDDDVAWILDHVGWHIVEASTPTAGIRQATYRLLHQAFVEHYQQGRDPAITHRRILEAMTGGIAGPGWLAADGYLRRHASAHAMAAGGIGPLVRDPGFLAVAEPKSLALDLPGLADPKDRLIAGLYQRSIGRLVDLDPIERMAIIHMTAQIEAPDLAPALEPPVATPWRCLWARCEETSPNQILCKYDGAVASVAMGRLGGRPVVASCSGCHIRVTDARTGDDVAELSVPGDEPGSLAWIEKGGRPVLAVAAGTRLLFWDPGSGGPDSGGVDFGEPVVAIASTSVAGVPAIAVAAGHTIRLHGLDSGEDLREPLDMGEPIVSLAARTVAGRATLVWHMAKEWCLLDVDGQGGETLRYEGLHGSLCIALDETEGMPTVAVGTSSSIELLDPRTNSIQSSLIGHNEAVTALAFGLVGGRSKVASGSEDGTVRLWSPETALPFRYRVENLLNRRPLPIGALALGRVGGRQVIVAMAELRLRMYDADNGEPITANGGVADGIRRWVSKITGRPRRASKTGSGFATSLSFGRLGTREVVVMADSDGTIGLYDGPSLEKVATFGRPGPSLYDAEMIRVGDRDIVQFNSPDYTRQKDFLDAADGTSLNDLVDGWGRRAVPHFRHVTALARLGGRAVLIVAGEGWKVGVVDLERGKLVGPMLDAGLISDLLLTEHDEDPVGLALAHGCRPALWNLAEGRRMGEPLERSLKPDMSENDILMGQVDGRLAVVGWHPDGILHVWDHRGGAPARTIRTGTPLFTQVALDGEGRLFFGSSQGMMALSLAPLAD